ILLLGAVGPWSATAVSRRDQTQRLRTALREARIDPRRLPAHSAVVDSALYHRIDGATRYLYQNHGIEAVRRVVPGVPATRAWTLLATDLGLREGCRRRGGFVEGVLEWRGGVQGLAGGTLAPLTVWAPARPGNRGATAGTGTRVPPRGPARGPAFVRTGTDSVAFRLDGNRLHASGPSWTARADAGPLAREIAGGTASACLRVSRPAAAASFGPGAALLVLRDAAGVVRAQVVVTTVQLDIEPAPAGGGPPALSLRWIEGMVVVPARP
ncbi:MAG TPA: hypothetical protein VNP72_03160, partial [Longimicrobium sp.]|nr:hypothetical protein [Longimicrobium sp.]